ncbi:MAG TPA: hypothetical protein VF494_08025 [Candidatus Limnocylindrales bacterium]
MELLLILLPLMAFLALAAGLIVVFRGSGRIAARSRELQQFQAAVKDLSFRADTLLGAAAGQIDAVRHQQAGPEAISQTVADATETLERYGEEARSWSGPRRVQAIRDDLVGDLERAIRALGMVEHGAGMLASARRGARDLEAQTSIKRGYLNLIHAREAIARHAGRAEDLAVDDARAGRPGFLL